MNNSELINSQL